MSARRLQHRKIAHQPIERQPTVKAVVLGGGALALYGVGHPVAAVAMAVVVVVVVNTGLADTFRRRTPRGPQSLR